MNEISELLLAQELVERLFVLGFVFGNDVLSYA